MKAHISFNKVFWSFLIITFLACSLAFAAPVGKISAIEGRVDVLKAGKNVAAPVSLGAPVDVGDIYRTKTKSRAVITFNNNNILKIAPSSRIEIQQYMIEKENSSAVMKLYRGKVQAVAHQDFAKRVAAFAEGNKFEVHTPNAVAGIRGSDMIVGFTSGTTMVVFISGQGYLYNPSSPQAFTPIVAGQVSFITGENTPTAPVKASEAIISGEVGAFIQVIEIKTEGKKDEIIPPTPTVYVPPDITVSGATNFTGSLWNPDGYFLRGLDGLLLASVTPENSSLTGFVYDSTSLGTISASGKAEYLGEYGPDDVEAMYSLIYGKSDKSGAFFAETAGVRGSFLNRLAGFYVEGGNLYFLTGDTSGALTEDQFSMSGTLQKSASIGTTSLTTDPDTLFDTLFYSNRYVPTQLFINTYSYIISDSGIQITPDFRVRDGSYIITNEGKRAAVFAEIYYGSYAAAGSTSLPYLGYYGANGFGGYEYALGPLFYSHDSTNMHFMISTLLQSIGTDTVIGPYLGVYSIKYFGMYCPYGEIFRMAGAGTFVATPARFFGDWGVSSLYYNNSGVMTYAGDDYGYFGGTTAPWTSPASLTAIGQYTLSVTGQPHYLMNSYVSGSAYPSVSSPAGTIKGYTGAIWKDGTSTTVGSISDGTLRALYISPPDADEYVTAGIMKGSFTGSYYDLSPYKMWGIYGTLTPTQLASGLNPADLTYGSGTVSSGGLSGDFGGTGSITSSYVTGGTKFLYTSEQSLPFGIINIKFAGNSDYRNSYYDKPTGNPSWSAAIRSYAQFDSTSYGWGFLIADAKYGTWTDTGEITGSVTGTAMTPLRLYDVEGKFTGVNTYDYSWVGQVIGSYTGTDLKFFSYFSGKMVDVADDDGLYFEYMSNLYGHFGGTTSLWSGSNIPVKIIGTVGATCLWYTPSPIYSYNVSTSLKTTYDGGAYYGLAGGSEYDSALAGEFIALYIDNSATPKAGVLKASLSGSIYDTDMFEMDGLVNRTEKSTNIGISASSLYSNISQGSLDGTGAYLSGTFNNGATISGGEDTYSYGGIYSGVTYSIGTQRWGIYGLPLLGEFGELSTVPTTWSATVGSTGTFGKYLDASSNAQYDTGYWLATITGTVPTGATTTEGKLLGTLDGTYLTHTRLGTMDGDVYGTYESGYWKAIALGTWTGTPLTSSLTFSTEDAAPTTLWRALPGDYYEGDFTQYDASANSYYNYKFRYIKTSGKGIGKIKDDYSSYREKYYFPGGAMFKEDQDGKMYVSSWDIGSIDEVTNLPSWMDPDNSTFTPTAYSVYASFLDVLEKRTDDYLEAILGMTGYPWSTGGTPVYIIGKYTAYDSDYTKPTIVTTPFLFGTLYTPYVEGGTAYGAYGVTLGGFLADDARGVQMAIRGLYVGPDNQTAGVLRQSQLLTGSLYSDIGMWDAEGTLVATVMNSNFSTNSEGVTISNFSDNIVDGTIMTGIMGHFTGDSDSLIGNALANSGVTRNIKGQDWGIYSSTIWAGGFGVTSTTLPGTWSAQLGGWGQFGEYKDASDNWQADTGIMLIPTLSGTLTGGVVKASHTGTVGQFMTMTKMGTISDVGVLGVYTQPLPVEANKLYSWQGITGGVWNTTQYFTFASSFSASNKRFAEMHTGGYFNGSYNEYCYYYDNDTKYADISFFSDADRTLITQRKYEPDSGPFSTPTWYEYTYEKGTNTFSDYTTGTDYPFSFADTFFSDLAVSKGYHAYNQYATSYNFSQDGSISAIMGGVGDLWAATQSLPATVYFLGDYDHWYGKPTIFGTDIVSYNVTNNTNTTLDGKGAYTGYIGGREIDAAIDGSIYAIYIDGDAVTYPAGILKGTFTGKVYSEIEMWAGQGSIYPIYLMDVSIPPGSLLANIYTRDFDSSSGSVSFTLNGNEMGGSIWPFVYQGEGTTFYATEGSWGVWQSAIGGKYTGITPTDSWTATIEYIDSTRIMGNGVIGTKWSGNKFEGTTVGYGADIQPAQTYTWISVGELKGTFNPTLYTYQAGIMGVSVETNTYLTLAATTAGQAKLQALGIPAIQVGIDTLTLTGGPVNGFTALSMNDVKFFATSAGGKPSVWATESVTGTYTAPPATGTAISLTGSTLNAAFTFKQWNTTGDNAGKWLGSVSGTGGFNDSTTFRGAAAGKGATAGSGSITGTAAGIAK